MEVNNQLNDTSALPPRKDGWQQFNKKPLGSQSWSGCGGGEKNISPPPTTATRNWIQILQSPNVYLTTYIEL